MKVWLIDRPDIPREVIVVGSHIYINMIGLTKEVANERVAGF